MGKPLPLETRRAIIQLIQRGDCTQEEIAKIFKIGYRSVQRYWSLFSQTGDVDSHAKFGGHKKPLLAPHEQEIRSSLSKKPDMTLEELRGHLAKKNIYVCQTSLFCFLKALGYSNKKNGIWDRAETQGCRRTKGSIQKTAKRT